MLKRFLRAWGRGSQSLYSLIHKASGGRVEVLNSAFRSFSQARATEAAASIAFFSLFSLFPLMLFLIAGISYVMAQDYTSQQLFQYIRILFPVSQSVIVDTLNLILKNRPTFGIIALVGLLWAASGAFNSLAININRAWSEAQVRNFLQSRLVAILMVGILVGLVFISLLATTLVHLIANARLPVLGGILNDQSFPWRAIINLVPFTFRLLILWGLYRWVPTTQVRWRAAFWGALVAAVAWELITDGFTLYLSSPWARYELVYGSLATIVVLMFWLYLSSSIALFGAHLTACLTKP